MLSVAQIVRQQRVLLIAHRGNSRVAAENTLPAFESALAVGVDFIELDTHDSADGVPMVIHDATLDRTTDARTRWHWTDDEKIPVASKTAAQIDELDAGTWFNPRLAGTRVPTLAAAIDTVIPRAMLMIERKSGSVENCLRVVRDSNAVEQVTVQAFDWEFVAEAHRQEPRLVLGALGSKEFDPRKAVEAASIGATIVNWSANDLTAEAIAAIHEAGLRAWTWTVDDPAQARRLIAAGIDALTSNVPAMIKEVLRR
ncbi:MAG TPA: glycerophosphodiester phosphodiesterase family protein [Pirellulales bacterium]|jgi:glycerophosphoryl diester phosphodiesterase|nr:glycerophosphodiester phosphodiesterase family protein [Pirellulales bacterium]